MQELDISATVAEAAFVCRCVLVSLSLLLQLPYFALGTVLRHMGIDRPEPGTGCVSFQHPYHALSHLVSDNLLQLLL